MPIPRDKFEKVKNIKESILKFLYENNKQAYTEHEILKGVGLGGHVIDIHYDLLELSLSEYIDSKTIDEKEYYVITNKGLQWGRTKVKS